MLSYSVYSNLRRERQGPLVGRHKAKPVEGDSYHLVRSRYAHLNPVRTTAAVGHSFSGCSPVWMPMAACASTWPRSSRPSPGIKLATYYL